MNTREIVLLTLLIVAFVLLVIAFLKIRKIERYRETKLDELVTLNKAYFENIELKDGIYLPYFEENASFIDYAFKSKGDKDLISGLELPKHYRFFRNKVFYLFDDVLKNSKEVETLENKTYLKLSKSVEKIGIMLCFGTKSNYIVTYEVQENKGEFKLKLLSSEVKQDEK